MSESGLVQTALNGLHAVSRVESPNLGRLAEMVTADGS